MTELRTDPIQDEKRLIEAARGDIAAIKPLYDRWVQPVYRFSLSRIGDPADAEDVTSQVFLSVCRSLSDYRGKGSFGAWVFTIARNKIHDHYRKTKPWQHLDAEPQDFEFLPVEAEGSDPAERAELRAHIGSLPENEQELLRLRYVAGLTYEEAGQVLGLSAGAARKRIFRLLARLRALMEDNDEEE